jgi:hypothetical protein
MVNTLETLEYILGEDLPLELTVTDEDGADLSTATATVTIKDASGATVLSATAMTGSGTTERIFLYLLQTGAAQTIPTTGHYKAEYKVTYGNVNDQAYQDIYVLPVPGSQLARVTSLAGVA